MKVASNIKQDQILEAAIKRFSYYGINKTTLTEIAEDLSVSKQVINYYFLDKQSLITAVAEKIYTEYLGAIDDIFNNALLVEEGFIKLIEVKRHFFQKYYQLVFPLDRADAGIAQPALTKLHREAKQTSLKQVADLLKKGIVHKELKPIDEVKTGGLILETLSALESCMKEKNAFPELSDFDQLHLLQKDVLMLFLNGLKLTT